MYLTHNIFTGTFLAAIQAACEHDKAINHRRQIYLKCHIAPQGNQEFMANVQ
jgi:hypothetical protein